MGGGGSSGGDTKTTMVPWKEQQPFLIQGYNAAGQALDQTPKGAYEGQYFAGADPAQLQARQQTLNFANTGAADLANAFGANVLGTARGDYLSPESNPFLKQNADAITSLSNTNLKENILPTINSGAIASGAFGGTRSQLQQGKAVGTAQQGLDATIAKMYMDNYAAERARMSDPNLIRAGFEAGVAPSMLLNEVGTANRADEQQILDEQLKHWQDQIDAPWRGLDRYAGIIGGAVSGGGTSSGQGVGTGASVIGGALGGAAAGASVGSVVPGDGTAVGAGIGGILGGLGGFLSRR